MKSPRIILVEPQTPANVGFVARVLANFGLSDWSIVAGQTWRGTEAERTGAPAIETLRGVQEAVNLTDALSGCSHVVGFTARSGRHRQVIDLSALPKLASEWGEHAKPAFVFGREDRGLEQQEVEACSVLVKIPTEGLHSFNLSHAVAIAMYEWFRSPSSHQNLDDNDARSWADSAARRRLAGEAFSLLESVDYPDRGNELTPTLRRVAAMQFETRDLRTLERVLRHARWLMGQSS
ncbi:MAG: hypothetical protein HN405_05305 [Planctomycetes bacterium]|nr:hypothetical protein [Planctomycetota bacterium]MBT4029044.1 hypothetical protein [Planctomycetota bacterium]MBT4560336.1 hypothetical protein [Planctomycetota bacterium]MBT5102116.1 hypothetical protein [Planctomycetota bacterium]MBT7012046.1 hypothetical protein [Planctomycetota bacterium]